MWCFCNTPPWAARAVLAHGMGCQSGSRKRQCAPVYARTTEWSSKILDRIWTILSRPRGMYRNAQKAALGLQRI
jgi:hypothetical protein